MTNCMKAYNFLLEDGINPKDASEIVRLAKDHSSVDINLTKYLVAADADAEYLRQKELDNLLDLYAILCKCEETPAAPHAIDALIGLSVVLILLPLMAIALAL